MLEFGLSTVGLAKTKSRAVVEGNVVVVVDKTGVTGASGVACGVVEITTINPL